LGLNGKPQRLNNNDAGQSTPPVAIRRPIQNLAQGRVGTPSIQVDSQSIASDESISAGGVLLRHLRRILTRQRMLQALLYFIQWALFCVILLIMATFNIWLILAVLFGKATGYLVFIGSPALEKVDRIAAAAAVGAGRGGFVQQRNLRAF